MAYIGRGTDNISNVEVLDNITFTGASSYTLQKGGANFVPVSANNILLSIDGVVQANNFSVSGSTIDFGTAVTGTCNFVLHFGTGLITTVQDGAVTTVKIGDDAVTYAKLQNLATANRVLGSTSTGLIGETQIATAMVSDDAITYAKMQDTSTANRVLGAASAGTIGEVQIATDMIADSQVDEAKLKISNAPTNGYFLSAQSGNTGGLTWAEAGGGNFIKLAGGDNITTDSNLSGYYTSDYYNYRWIFNGVSSSGVSKLNLRLYKSSGAISSGSYRYAVGMNYRSSSSHQFTTSEAGWNTTEFILNSENVSSNANLGATLIIDIFDPQSAQKKNVSWLLCHERHDGGVFAKQFGDGIIEDTDVHTGINIYSYSGNFGAQHWALYGMKV